jgi:hypothetical protein
MGLHKKRFFNISFLLLFFIITSSIHFLHTEHTLTKDDNCPACQFQSSSLTTAQINFFYLPPPAFFKFLRSYVFFNYTFVFSLTPNSRSPPQI